MPRFGFSIFCFTVFLVGTVDAQPPQRIQRGGENQLGRPLQPGGARQTRNGPNGQQTLPLLRIFDLDSDGELSGKEIEQAVATLQKLDKNQDEKLTAEELRPNAGSRSSASNSRGPVGRQNARGPNSTGPNSTGPSERQKSGSTGARGGGRNPARSDAAFARQVFTLDANRDDLISQAELPEHMHKAFGIADANTNGTLDSKELLVLAAQFRRSELNPDGDSAQMKNAPVKQGSRQQNGRQGGPQQGGQGGPQQGGQGGPQQGGGRPSPSSQR